MLSWKSEACRGLEDAGNWNTETKGRQMNPMTKSGLARIDSAVSAEYRTAEEDLNECLGFPDSYEC